MDGAMDEGDQPQQSDDELLRLIAAGNQQAFADLFRRLDPTSTASSSSSTGYSNSKASLSVIEIHPSRLLYEIINSTSITTTTIHFKNQTFILKQSYFKEVTMINEHRKIKNTSY